METAAEIEVSIDGGIGAAGRSCRMAVRASQAPGPIMFESQAAHDAAVENAISYFLANTPKVEVMLVGNQVVFYDTRVMERPEAFAHNIDSVTYNFSDSSVSLVGISQVIHDAQGLH